MRLSLLRHPAALLAACLAAASAKPLPLPPPG